MKRAAIVLIWLLCFSAQQPAFAIVHKNKLAWTASEWLDVVYRIYRSATPGGPYTRIAGGVINLTFNDTNVQSGDQWCYVVTAYKQDTKEESEFSPEACGVIP